MNNSDISIESPLKGQEVFNILIITVFTISIVFSSSVIGSIEIDSGLSSDSSYSIIQGNSLMAYSDYSLPVKKVDMVITAYSSTTWQTDSTPFITASGTKVRDGIVANNMLPIGTEIRIPELYGNKVFVVEDRMHSRKGSYHLDIWFPEYSQAKNFGAKRTYIEILEN